MKPRCRVLGVGLLAGLMVVSAAGCASHYRVIDPHSGRTYYTRRVHRKLGGDVAFRDARTGSRVRLESSEVKRVTEGEFQSGITVSQDAPREERAEKQ